MKNIKTIKAFILITSLLAFFTSCTNSLNDSNQETEKKAVVNISLDSTSMARTITPVITEAELTDFTLYKGIVSEANKIISWADQSAMENSPFEILTGEYTFILTAKANGVTLQGSKTVALVEGENEISFEIAVSDFGSENGTVKINLTYKDKKTANGAFLHLVDVNNSEKEYSGSINVNTYDESTGKTKISFEAKDIPAGTYRARTTVVVNSEKYVTYSDIVKVYSNHTSTGDYDCADFVKNGKLYTLPYIDRDTKNNHLNYIINQAINIGRDYNSDIVKGDVVTFSINGIVLSPMRFLVPLVHTEASVDGYWGECGNGEIVFDENQIEAGTFISESTTFTITETPKTLNKSDLYVQFIGGTPAYKSYPEEISFIADIQMSIDKTNREAPVTVAFDCGESGTPVASVTRYPGQIITDITTSLKGKIFDGWLDSENKKVDTVPEASSTLKANFLPYIEYVQTSEKAIEISRKTLEENSNGFIVAETDLTNAKASNKIIRFSWNENIPKSSWDFYNSGWHELSVNEKIVDYDLFKISEMLDCANQKDPSWNTYYFYDWGGENKVSPVRIYPAVTVTIDYGTYTKEYPWPSGLSLDSKFGYLSPNDLYTDAEFTKAYDSTPINGDITLYFDTSYTGKEYTLNYENYDWSGPSYYKYKADAVSYYIDTDLIKGDCVNLTVKGKAFSDMQSLKYTIHSSAPIDDYSCMLGGPVFGIIFDEPVKAGEYFSANIVYNITQNAKTLNNSDINFTFLAYTEEASSATHSDSISFEAEFKISVDKSKRMDPVTVSFDCGESGTPVASVTRYPGQTITDISSSMNGKIFDGWLNSENKKVDTVPEASSTLKANFIPYIEYVQTSDKAIEISRETLEANSDAYIITATDLTNSNASMRLVRFSYNESIPEADREYYVVGWHYTKEKEKTVDYDVFKISDMLAHANIIDPSWNTYFFYDWGGENKVSPIRICYPDLVTVTVYNGALKKQYQWPKGYPIGSQISSEYSFNLYKDSEHTIPYDNSKVTGDITLYAYDTRTYTVSCESNWDDHELPSTIVKYSKDNKRISNNDAYLQGVADVLDTREGYYYGYFLDSELTIPLSEENFLKSTSPNVKIYVKWYSKDIYARVTVFDAYVRYNTFNGSYSSNITGTYVYIEKGKTYKEYFLSISGNTEEQLPTYYTDEYFNVVYNVENPITADTELYKLTIENLYDDYFGDETEGSYTLYPSYTNATKAKKHTNGAVSALLGIQNDEGTEVCFNLSSDGKTCYISPDYESITVTFDYAVANWSNSNKMPKFVISTDIGDSKKIVTGTALTGTITDTVTISSKAYNLYLSFAAEDWTASGSEAGSLSDTVKVTVREIKLNTK